MDSLFDFDYMQIVQLQKQALCHARAGADIVAPSGELVCFSESIYEF